MAENSDVITPGVAFIDTETLGLDADHHPVWEIGIVLPSGEEVELQVEVTEHELSLAHPKALEIGRFKERYGIGTKPFSRDFVAHQLHDMLTERVHLAGAVVSFDEERLRRLMWRQGMTPQWHYHLIDVETLAVGYLAANDTCAESPMPAPPWDSEELSRAVGVDPEDFDRHTALGDARWAQAIYLAVMGQD